MRKIVLYILVLLCLTKAFASDLHLSDPILYLENGNAHAVLNISWNNAWNTKKNHDAIWLFFKAIPSYPQANTTHVKLLPDSHSKIADFSESAVDLDFDVAEDGTGLFLYPSKTYRGRISITIKVTLNKESFKNLKIRRTLLKAYGIEMVHIPSAPFTIGNSNEDAKAHGGFYNPKAKNPKSIYVSSEDSTFKIAKDGDLYYNKKEGYEGDQTGTIPSEFPKGVASFYIMKYEILEGQYCAFLNSLSEEWQNNRDITRIKNYVSQGGSIEKSDNIYKTLHPEKPCKFMRWEDQIAFADWVGLRPMTEFEFTKASRGTRKPVANELPWGTNNKYIVQRMPNADGNLEMRNGWSEDQLSDETLMHFGASFYWVMDLSGSMWERVISIGHTVGRNFKGSHGDGTLSDSGLATNKDWPSSNEESGGIGYRGGGFYGYDREYHEYNPFSPIAYRPYGAWHGVQGGRAYGGRLVRTVK